MQDESIRRLRRLAQIKRIKDKMIRRLPQRNRLRPREICSAFHRAGGVKISLGKEDYKVERIRVE